MRLERLKARMIIKNYKELCRLLGEPEKTGNGKIYQLQEIGRFCKFTQTGHSFIIEEIYNYPIEKIDKRGFGSRSIYTENISIQLLDYLVKNTRHSKDNRIFLTATDIFILTGMANKDYIPTKSIIKEFIKQTPGSLQIQDMSEFYFRTENKMREILASAIKNLTKRMIILCEMKHRVKDENGWRATAGKEEEFIMDIKNEVLLEMGYTYIGDVYLHRKSTEFYDIVNKRLEELYGWKKCYSGYSIGYGERLKINLQIYKRQLSEVTNHKYLLNNKLADFIDREAQNLYKKNQEEYERIIEEHAKEIERIMKTHWGEPNRIGLDDDFEEPFKYDDGYVERQRILTNKLIKLPGKSS